jgi:hypothetical protein
MRNLKIYADEHHPHTGLVSKKLSFNLLNEKNTPHEKEF